VQTCFSALRTLVSNFRTQTLLSASCIYHRAWQTSMFQISLHSTSCMNSWL
jgi:hypothetical protein